MIQDEKIPSSTESFEQNCSQHLPVDVLQDLIARKTMWVAPRKSFIWRQAAMRHISL